MVIFGDEEEIRTLAEFVSWSRASSKKFGIRTATLNPWFRGQADHKWPLKPSLYRGDLYPNLEREMLRDFRATAYEFVETRERSDIDWLFLAQHFGLPTRLLDWTENPLVALFFACNSHENPENACVWALNPWELNKTNFGLKSVPSTDSSLLNDYTIDISDSSVPRQVKAELPMALRPFHRFRRSNAQSGMFTIHGSKVQGLDKTKFVRRNRSACMIRAYIPVEEKLKILKELYAVGVHKGALFQSLEAVTETIRFRYGRGFLG